MIKRDAERELRRLSKQFKAVAITGPRQSGKTTLAKYVFSKIPYVNLENPDTRRYATEDPRGFLNEYSEGAVLDEVQRTPELFSYLQQILDESRKKGRFILTGSNNFMIQENISQTLAGRIAYLNLLPFVISEIPSTGAGKLSSRMLQGCYPPVIDQNLDHDRWYQNYIRTYIERDVRLVRNISNLDLFGRFLKLCAGRTGQLLNVNSLAIETGVDNKTIWAWLGLLENSFIIFRLFPHHRSFNKRIVKMPKLYFYDSGLVCSLLGIRQEGQIRHHPLYGNIFETFVVSELKKHLCNRGIQSGLWFWRDNTGHEVDILIESGNRLVPVEIKSGQTVTDEFFRPVEYWKRLSGTDEGIVIYAGNTSQRRTSGIKIVGWEQIHKIITWLFGSH